MTFSADQVEQILRAQQAVIKKLKARFPHLTTEETTILAGELVKVVLIEVAK